MGWRTGAARGPGQLRPGSLGHSVRTTAAAAGQKTFTARCSTSGLAAGTVGASSLRRRWRSYSRFSREAACSAEVALPPLLLTTNRMESLPRLGFGS